MGHQPQPRDLPVDLTQAEADRLAGVLQALATSSRLRIVAVLQQGPMNVGEIAAAVDMEQSAVSHQLRHLRDLGFVAVERQGRTKSYSLLDQHVTDIAVQALSHLDHLRLEASPRPRT